MDEKKETGGSGPGGEDRTVFMPTQGPFAAPDADPASFPADDGGWGPGPGGPGETTAPGWHGPSEPPPPQSRSAVSDPPATGFRTAYTPRTDGKSIEVGDVLNHIFEVKRFIARGGMGEVFEGCNINSDERVAIKVMLPSLAADPNVISMFRKEARTLTRLQHEALVQYRVLAQEPQLGVLYIVTEFVDGVNLSDMLGKIQPTPEELTGLLRRLASGLRAAHALGAIHRDISPDNVLLEGGELRRAKIIDFGIAKDLDPGSATIVGDGFAGKLSYVAPEQLGAYGRDVGPWTDIYSLALVILATGQGRNINMGGTLFDAVEKRRVGPDISTMPESLKPVLEAMLRPDPKDRLRSADEVLKMLDRRGGDRGAAPPQTPAGAAASTRALPRSALIGGGAALVALLGLGTWLMMPGEQPPAQQGPAGAPSGLAVAAPGDPVAKASAAINSMLPNVGCTWLDVTSLEAEGATASVSFKGVAGDPAQASQQVIEGLRAAGFSNANADFSDVATILPVGCSALDAYRSIRDPEGRRIVPAQQSFDRTVQDGGKFAGEVGARIVFDFTPGEGEFSLYGIEPSGRVEQLTRDRRHFQDVVQQNAQAEQKLVTETSPGRYRFEVETDNDKGWTGFLLIRGGAPFPAEVTAPPLGQRGPDWIERFTTAAATSNPAWKGEMVWIKLD